MYSVLSASTERESVIFSVKYSVIAVVYKFSQMYHNIDRHF